MKIEIKHWLKLNPLSIFCGKIDFPVLIPAVYNSRTIKHKKSHSKLMKFNLILFQLAIVKLSS